MLPTQHVVPSLRPTQPGTAIALDASPKPAAGVPEKIPAHPQESQTPGTSGELQGMRVQSIREAQQAIPHLRKYNVISDSMLKYKLVEYRIL